MVEFNTAAETKPRLTQFGIKIQKPRYIIVQYFFVYYIRKSVAARKVCNFYGNTGQKLKELQIPQQELHQCSVKILSSKKKQLTREETDLSTTLKC